MTPAEYVTDYLAHSVAAMNGFAADTAAQSLLVGMADATVAAMRAGKKQLIAGNGGRLTGKLERARLKRFRKYASRGRVSSRTAASPRPELRLGASPLLPPGVFRSKVC